MTSNNNTAIGEIAGDDHPLAPAPGERAILASDALDGAHEYIDGAQRECDAIARAFDRMYWVGLAQTYEEHAATLRYAMELVEKVNVAILVDKQALAAK